MKALRILHIANRAEKHWGNRFYSYPYKMNNGFVRNGHCVYWLSDRDITRSLSVVPSRSLNAAKCNRKILEVCRNFGPDVVVFAHSEILKNETLQAIREKHKAIIVQYNFDLLHDENIKKLNSRNGYVDFNFITTGGDVLGKLANKGSSYAYMPNPVDASIDCLQNFANKDLPIDVFFAGQVSDRVDSSDLRTQIESLPKDLSGLKIGLYNGLWGYDYLKILGQAKMGLNISVGLKEKDNGHYSQTYYSSDRIGQYLGNGLLTFVEKKFQLSSVYGPNCLVEVENYEELKDRILFFSKNDALRVKQAEKSYLLAHAQFNEKLVTRYILEVATGSSFSHSYQWPSQVWGA